MGGKEGDKSFLSTEDFEKRGIKIDPNWTRLQALLVVASLASLKLKEDNLKKKKKKQPPVKSNGFLKLNKDKNKSASGICVADDEKRARLLREKSLRNPMKEENSSARVSPREGRKILGDSMKSRRVFDDEEHGIYQQQQKKRLKGEVILIDIPESLKEYIKKKRNGTEIKRLIQKSLYASDVSDYHNRLSIPVSQVEHEFLSPEEKKIVEKAGKLKVVFIEPSLDVCEIVLAKWKSSYVLITEWNNVKARNKLKEGDEVQVWSFRTQEKLSLALVIILRRQV